MSFKVKGTSQECQDEKFDIDRIFKLQRPDNQWCFSGPERRVCACAVPAGYFNKSTGTVLFSANISLYLQNKVL